MYLASFSFCFPSPVQVGFCFTEVRPRTDGGRERVTGSQSAEGKHTGAPEPGPGGGEPETETRTATHHCRVKTHKITQQPAVPTTKTKTRARTRATARTRTRQG